MHTYNKAIYYYKKISTKYVLGWHNFDNIIIGCDLSHEEKSVLLHREYTNTK